MLRFPWKREPEPEPKPDATLLAAIEMGIEAKQFVNGPLFRHICEEAESKVIAAQNELCRVNPTDVEKIIELQAVARRFDHFVSTLNDLVVAGDSAWRLAKEMEER